MKKIFFIIISLILLISGCGLGENFKEAQAPESQNAQTLIPFLTYYTNKKEVIAKLSYWDLKNNKVSFSDKAVYTTLIDGNSIIQPIMWDGNKRIVLFEDSSPDKEYKDNAKIIKNYNQDIIYGRDIEVKKNTDNSNKNKDYDIYLSSSNGIIKKKAVLLFKTKDENSKDIIVGEYDIPSYVDYDRKTGEITFIFKHFFETRSSIFTAKCNVNNIEKVEWSEIKLSKDIHTGGDLTPYPTNSALIGTKYYIQSALSIAQVDLDNKESKVLDDVNKICRGIIKEGNFVPDYPKDIAPVGVYGDILILKVPVSSDKGMEYLICAFKDNVFLGAIHLTENDKWNIFDENKKMIQVIDVKDKHLYKEFNSDVLYFPFYGV